MEGEPEQAEATVAMQSRAAEPKALADVAVITLHATPTSGVSTSATRTPHPMTIETLDKGDLTRSKMFHVFGMIAPLIATALSFMLGGDRGAQVAFVLGAVLMAICNAGLFYLTSNPERYDETWEGVLWVISTIAIQPAIAYFGPFSAVVMVDILGIMFVALGRRKTTALATAVVCIVGHLVIAVPMMFHVWRDVGVIPAMHVARSQLYIAEVMILVFMLSSYALARWARTANARALSDLQSALRVIGDREQALAEVNDAEARQKRAAEGRWTNQLLGGFKLGVVLGRGAMGEVYEAVGPQNQPAAVKLLDARATASPGLVDRFHREMDIAKRLESPYIVQVFAVSPPDAPVPYIAMEKLEGTDLATRLRAEVRLPADELVLLVDQVAQGLEVARLAGVVHRDLKPHNLFQHLHSTWKILDFGVSKFMDSEGTLTGEGIVGTPQYMAPEQASGAHVTHLADVYGLGAIAYRCLTGRSPFKGKDLAQLAYQVVHSPPERPSNFCRISVSVEAVLAIAMAKDPRRRFPSALLFAQALIAARRNKPMDLAPPENAWRV